MDEIYIKIFLKWENEQKWTGRIELIECIDSCLFKLRNFCPLLLEILSILQLFHFFLPSSSGLSIMHLFTCLTVCHNSLELYLFSFILLFSFYSDCIISFDLSFNYLILSFASSNLVVNPSRIFNFSSCVFHLQLYYLVLYFFFYLLVVTTLLKYHFPGFLSLYCQILFFFWPLYLFFNWRIIYRIVFFVKHQ